MSAITRFNLRVYGIMLNDAGEVLLAHESINDFHFTKFPGGGLEHGEGPAQCVVREFMEELNIAVEVEDHFYTTDFFQESAFRKGDQIISIYFKVKNLSKRLQFDKHVQVTETTKEIAHFEWVSLQQLHPGMLTFPIDKIVCEKILQRYA